MLTWGRVAAEPAGYLRPKWNYSLVAKFGTEIEPNTYARPSHVAYRLTFTLIARIIVPLEGRQ